LFDTVDSGDYAPAQQARDVLAAVTAQLDGLLARWRKARERLVRRSIASPPKRKSPSSVRTIPPRKEITMYTLLKSLRERQVWLSEPVSFVAALVIAELFYKFHSFLLETGAFLVTWFVLGAIVHPWRLGCRRRRSGDERSVTRISSRRRLLDPRRDRSSRTRTCWSRTIASRKSPIGRSPPRRRRASTCAAAR
jgi:hypothetical protein